MNIILATISAAITTGALYILLTLGMDQLETNIVQLLTSW
jgi:hypothetical protein